MFFDHDKGKSHSSGKLLFAARIIPYRGSWLDIEFDAKDIVHARIDRRRKIPVTSLLYALGLDGEEILSTFYKKVVYTRVKDGWRVPFDADRMKGIKAIVDLIDADTGEVAIEAGRKLTVRSARAARREAASRRCAPSTPTSTASISPKISTIPQTGEIFAEAGDEITEKSLAALLEAGFDELPILDIDHVNIGPYIRNTLKVDKNSSREDALFDIYRVMRPGEPPTIESAEAMFQSLFFDPRALRSLGGRPREDEHAPRSRRARHACACCARRTSSRSSRRSSTCATAAARSTTSTISATAACARSAN